MALSPSCSPCTYLWAPRSPQWPSPRPIPNSILSTATLTLWNPQSTVNSFRLSSPLSRILTLNSSLASLQFPDCKHWLILKAVVACQCLTFRSRRKTLGRASEPAGLQVNHSLSLGTFRIPPYWKSFPPPRKVNTRFEQNRHFYLILPWYVDSSCPWNELSLFQYKLHDLVSNRRAALMLIFIFWWIFGWDCTFGILWRANLV